MLRGSFGIGVKRGVRSSFEETLFARKTRAGIEVVALDLVYIQNFMRSSYLSQFSIVFQLY